MNGWCRWLILTAATAGVVGADGGKSSPKVADEGFDSRGESWFRAESGKPLRRASKQPPLAPGRGNYTRAYSYSIVGFAARCFHLGEMLDEANAALVENARHYLDHPTDIIDRDSFHWRADIVMRLIDMYGPGGTVDPGRLTAETEAVCLRPIWIDVKESAKHNQPDHATTKTWHFHIGHGSQGTGVLRLSESERDRFKRRIQR